MTSLSLMISAELAFFAYPSSLRGEGQR